MGLTARNGRQLHAPGLRGLVRMHTIAFFSGFLLAAGTVIGTTSSPLQTVDHVDLNRYVGKWYEIARYPNRFENFCDRDVTAEYSRRNDGKIRVVNTCVTSAGKSKRAEGTAIVVDTQSNAKLKVTFFWPFYGKYWVIDLEPTYEYAVVGEPSRKYLWILSRSPHLEHDTYRQILGRIAQQGYEPNKLLLTRQTSTKP
jgi:apolipoprotein D and lipocalin family protein